MTRASILGLTFLMTCVGAISLAQTTSSPTPQSSPAASATPSASPVALGPLDELANAVAVNFIHRTNFYEIQSSQNALGRLQTPAAQQIANDLIDDHQASDQTVQQFAAQNN